MLKEWKKALEQDCPEPFNNCRIVFRAVPNPKTGEFDFYTDIDPSIDSPQDDLDVSLL